MINEDQKYFPEENPTGITFSGHEMSYQSDQLGVFISFLSSGIIFYLLIFRYMLYFLARNPLNIFYSLLIIPLWSELHLGPRVREVAVEFF